MTVRELIYQQYDLIIDKKFDMVRHWDGDAERENDIAAEKKDISALRRARRNGELLPGFRNRYPEVLEEKVLTWVSSMLYLRTRGEVRATYVKTLSGEYAYTYAENALIRARFPLEELNDERFRGIGMVHIFHGEGDGRTGAAFGLAMRVIGHGGAVVAAQFLTGRRTGESIFAEQSPKMTLIRGLSSEKFTFQMTAEERAEAARYTEAVFAEALSLSENEDVRLLILADVFDACELGFLPWNCISKMMLRRREDLEIILTGDRFPRSVAAYADYITLVSSERHPLERGIQARLGIDY